MCTCASSYNTDIVISASVVNFMKYIKEFHNISIEHVDVNNFLYLYQKKRKFNPPKDIFLYICEYLEWNYIIKFTTICRDFMEYYPNIWNIIQKQVSPLSTKTIILHKSIKDLTKLYMSIKHEKNIKNKRR